MNFLQRLAFRVFPPKVIPIIINSGDVANAGKYSDIRNCLMATALKLRGYKDVMIGGTAIIEGRSFAFNCKPIVEAWANGNYATYDSSIIGTKFELTRI